ncbi:hypothetical protein GP486_008905 [Trichoglossum hirsutum]|uniref:Uncharacterized protein n=1 Tax=Trichoglossum hirsutum TaxID=265104 RepID=A0A9P8KZU7_9PEZI|nr:hypothetical protein GP486_008905 [Trichoglossum hirsutum]
MTNTDPNQAKAKLDATVPAAPAPAPTPSNPWTWPSNKVLAGGIGGVLAWAIFAAMSTYLHIDPTSFLQPYVSALFIAMGVNPPPSAQGGVAIILGQVVAYFTPLAYRDIRARLNNTLIAFAAKDKDAPNVSIQGILQETASPPSPPVVPK